MVQIKARVAGLTRSRFRGRRGAIASIATAMAMMLSGLVVAGPSAVAAPRLVAGTPPPAPYGWVGDGEVDITGHHTYVNNPGGCLFVAANPGLGAPFTSAGNGFPRMDSYASIDWNSNPPNGTPCGNQSYQIAGNDFYLVQVLLYFNSSSSQWIQCNFGPKIWNPGPRSHEVRTGYSWYNGPPYPCWDGTQPSTLFGMWASAADIYGAGYGTWAKTTSNIEIAPAAF